MSMKSVVSYPNRGEGGKNNYRGNCSPILIEDIIKQFHLKQLSDFMVGSGTTEDICKQMNVKGTYLDLNRGYNMITMDLPERPENIFWHPPYDDIIIYSDNMYDADSIIKKYNFDPRTDDLSRCSGWNDFVSKMNYCCMKQFSSLEKGGRMFVLMGDIKKKGRLYSMLADIVKPGILEQIVIKMQHNCLSYNHSYSGDFIPIVHEYLMIVKKELALFFDVRLTKIEKFDMRDSLQTTWKDVIASILEDSGSNLPLSEIYRAVEGHRKCSSNQHWKEKVRQTLNRYENFRQATDGTWQLAS